MKTSQDDVELVLTGGGSIIVPEKLKGISNVIRPLIILLQMLLVQL